MGSALIDYDGPLKSLKNIWQLAPSVLQSWNTTVEYYLAAGQQRKIVLT